MRLPWLLNTFSPGKEHIAEVACLSFSRPTPPGAVSGGHALLAEPVILQDSWVCEHRAVLVSTPGGPLEKRCRQQCPLGDYCHRVTLPSSKALLGFHDQDGLVVMDGNNLNRHKRWLAQPHRKSTGTWERAVRSRAIPRQPSLLVLSACLCVSVGSILLIPCAPGSKSSRGYAIYAHLEENKNWNDS